MSKDTNPDRVRELANHFEEGRRGDTHFAAGLFRLILKADWENIEHLRAGFPDEVAFVECWRRMPNGENWINRHLHNELTDADYTHFGEYIRGAR